MSDLCDKLRESALRSVCGNTDLADKTLYAIAADRISELEEEVERWKRTAAENRRQWKNYESAASDVWEKLQTAEAKLVAIEGVKRHSLIIPWGSGSHTTAKDFVLWADVRAILHGESESE